MHTKTGNRPGSIDRDREAQLTPSVLQLAAFRWKDTLYFFDTSVRV